MTDIARELLEEIRIGTRRIAGTDWPIDDQLWREGTRTWTIVRELCNGVPRTSESYRSEASAREAFGSRIEGRKPRAGEASGERLGIRVTAAEKKRWTEAAEREGQALGDWIRDAADLAIARGSTR